MADKNKYTAKQIQVLEGLEPVRKRPGMYVGSTDSRGLHECVREIVDNSVDESFAGVADTVWVTLHKDGSATVKDNGRGIPVDKHKSGVSALELTMTKLHAGGKFGGGAYKISGGLHGVGASVVNALSSYFRVVVLRNNKAYYQEYKEGTPLKKVSLASQKQLDGWFPIVWNVKLGENQTGTLTTFYPDKKVFNGIPFESNKVKSLLKDRAYLVAGLSFHLLDEIKDEETNYYFEGGIKSLVKHSNRNKNIISDVIYVSKDNGQISCEVAIQYTDSYNENVKGFVNGINTIDGGTHVTGFRTALTRTITDYTKRQNGNGNQKDESITGEDMKEGLTAVVYIKMPSEALQFESQTKAKLNNPEVLGFVSTTVKEGLDMYFEEHPAEARKIIEKVSLAAKARLAARAAKDAVLRKGALEGGTLPGSLADCQSKDPEISELYIVEGDSAGGCFSGETKIALTDGRNISFRDLVKEYKKGKKNYCYTIGTNGSVEIVEIENPRLTNKKAGVIKVVLDNNEKIICTPDHLFMLRDGSYKKAKDLIQKDSLMPLKRQLSIIGRRITIKGYELVYDPLQLRWIFTHILSDKFNLKNNFYSEVNGEHKHHMDFDKTNNNPNNIMRMDKREHLNLHSKHAYKTLQRPDVLKKLALLKKTSEYREKIKKAMTTPRIRKLLSQRAKLQWQNKDLLLWRSKTTQEQWTGEFRKKRKIAYNRTYLQKSLSNLHDLYITTGYVYKEEYQKLRKQTKDKNLLKYETIKNRFFFDDDKKFRDAVINYNHKIKRVVHLNKRLDVYDLEVKETHNFALASGVFVHNSAKQGRDRKFQAILPLFGKVLNTERARLDQIIKSDKFKNLIIAIGGGIGEQFNIEKLRYHRIIIMADADVDGSHIKCLYLTFLYRHMPEVIKRGYVYVAMPPLYKIVQNKNIKYFYTEEEKEEHLKKTDGKVSVQRYKGLGEMNATELWETTMNPAARILKQITVEDADAAGKMFEMLMGEEVPPRKKFIQTHAKMANLDI